MPSTSVTPVRLNKDGQGDPDALFEFLGDEVVDKNKGGTGAADGQEAQMRRDFEIGLSGYMRRFHRTQRDISNYRTQPHIIAGYSGDGANWSVDTYDHVTDGVPHSGTALMSGSVLYNVLGAPQSTSEDYPANAELYQKGILVPKMKLVRGSKLVIEAEGTYNCSLSGGFQMQWRLDPLPTSQTTFSGSTKNILLDVTFDRWPSLTDLDDVDTENTSPAPATDNVLAWDGSRWVNAVTSATITKPTYSAPSFTTQTDKAFNVRIEILSQGDSSQLIVGYIRYVENDSGPNTWHEKYVNTSGSFDHLNKNAEYRIAIGKTGGFNSGVNYTVNSYRVTFVPGAKLN